MPRLLLATNNAGKVAEYRVLLRDCGWDVVTPTESALRLKVATPPVHIFAVGEKVWLEFDPRQMAPIA